MESAVPYANLHRTFFRQTSFLPSSKPANSVRPLKANHLLDPMLYTVSQKNDTDVSHYNFNLYQPISVIFGRFVAEIIYYQM